MTEYRLLVHGCPIAKKRPRFARRGKFVMTYNSQETEEGRFLFEIKQQWKRDPLTGAIELRAEFYMPIPKSTSKKKTLSMIAREIKHTKKPDLDNCLKFIKDCLNQTVWIDDSQVFKVQAEKIYSDKPRTIIFVQEIKSCPEAT